MAENIVFFLLGVVVTAIIVVIVRNLSSLEHQIAHRFDPQFGVEDEQFQRAIGNLLGPGLKTGNKVTTLVNGREYFPEMLAAIRSARETVTLETFIYWSGSIGRQFSDAMMERCRAGVKVHLLVDWLGSWKMDRELLKELKESGIQFRRFRPLNWHNLAIFNNRTHRKILVVDGRVAYTGGAGIADAWDGDAQDTQHWRDNQYRLEGPAVASMQSAFMDNWLQADLKVMIGDDYFPRLESVGNVCAQVFPSGPTTGSDSARLMYLLSISCACRSIRLGQAYFIPDKLSIETIVDACRRGVKVELIIQGPTDAILNVHCTWFLLRPLLEAGVEVYEYNTALYHVKTMIIDELWVSVGSTNFDTRSFRLNDEANLNVLDRDFANYQVELFERDKTQCRRITLDDWHKRGWRKRILDRGASLLRSQL
jgi:cardiolipin synthase A/B